MLCWHTRRTGIRVAMPGRPPPRPDIPSGVEDAITRSLCGRGGLTHVCKFFQMIPSVVNLVISVWGMLLWANMTNECMSFYGNDFSNLLLLFKINVVLLAVSAVVLVIVVCVGVATLTAAISQGGKTNRYENIPDHPGGAAPSGLSSVSSTLTEEYV